MGGEHLNERTASASEIRRDFAERVNRVAYTDESVVIERRGRPLAALISYKAYRMFQAFMDSIQDEMDAEALKGTVREGLYTSWLRPVGHIWTQSAQPWVHIPANTLNFEKQPREEEVLGLVRAWKAQHAVS